MAQALQGTPPAPAPQPGQLAPVPAVGARPGPRSKVQRYLDLKIALVAFLASVLALYTAGQWQQIGNEFTDLWLGSDSGWERTLLHTAFGLGSALALGGVVVWLFYINEEKARKFSTGLVPAFGGQVPVYDAHGFRKNTDEALTPLELQQAGRGAWSFDGLEVGARPEPAAPPPAPVAAPTLPSAHAVEFTATAAPRVYNRSVPYRSPFGPRRPT